MHMRASSDRRTEQVRARTLSCILEIEQDARTPFNECPAHGARRTKAQLAHRHAIRWVELVRREQRAQLRAKHRRGLSESPHAKVAASCTGLQHGIPIGT